MDWDIEVDVLCAGSGVASLASAVLAVEMGAEVLVTGPPPPTSGDGRAGGPEAGDFPHLWSGLAAVPDPETAAYFAELSADLDPVRDAPPDAGVPITTAHEPVAVKTRRGRRTVAPFFGARLRDWAARCLASPYGYLYTRVSDWPSTTLRTSEGEAIEVAEVGSMSPDPDDVAGSVLRWLDEQALERGIDVHADSHLQRIVFEEGAVVGAVLDAPGGPVAVRTRHGVVISMGEAAATSACHEFTAGDVVRVCLVGRSASRFGRVELLTVTPGEASASTCREANRHLHVNLRTTLVHSGPGYCSKV